MDAGREWVFADHFLLRKQVDVAVDLRHPLPFEDEVWQGITMHHVLEHLEYSDACRLLEECHRVLKEEGLLRVVVPDAGKAARLYAAATIHSGDVAPEESIAALMPEHFGPFATPMAVLNEIFHSIPENRHFFGWDHETLGLAMKEAGFGSVQVVQAGCSADPVLGAADNLSWSKFSLYLEARR